MPKKRLTNFARLNCEISPDGRARLEYALEQRQLTEVGVTLNRLVDEAIKKCYPLPPNDKRTNTLKRRTAAVSLNKGEAA